jgi:uncharacterized membrane protein YqjE
MDPERNPEEHTGLGGSVRRFLSTGIDVVQTRFAILSSEIAEERARLVRTVLVIVGALFCLQAGLFLAILYIVLFVANENRLAAIGIAALTLLLLAVGAALWLRWWLKHRPPMFATTMAELRKDRDRLTGKKS